MVKHNNPNLPAGFVYLTDIIPDIDEAIYYATSDNFIGEVVNGYKSPKAILTYEAAKALLKVYQSALQKGLSLKIYDAYRPKQAVKHFLSWINENDNSELKQSYYPDFSKSELFEAGYLSSESAHCRGSTVDLTLVDIESGKELDMGTRFDFFGDQSWTSYQGLSEQQLANRQLLQNLMRKYGFRGFELEWWHFTLKDEPFPNRSFDFIVQ